jgi:hypothetical protein
MWAQFCSESLFWIKLSVSRHRHDYQIHVINQWQFHTCILCVLMWGNAAQLNWLLQAELRVDEYQQKDSKQNTDLKRPPTMFILAAGTIAYSLATKWLQLNLQKRLQRWHISFTAFSSSMLNIWINWRHISCSSRLCCLIYQMSCLKIRRRYWTHCRRFGSGGEMRHLYSKFRART